MKNKNLVLVVVLVLLIGLAVLLFLLPPKTGAYDDFASCLEEKGALFYGAFWCPSCQEQKALFGRSAEKLPYFECSTPDGRNQLQECKDKGIESYPTWDFEDGERTTGVLGFEELSSKTGCVLPS